MSLYISPGASAIAQPVHTQNPTKSQRERSKPHLSAVGKRNRQKQIWANMRPCECRDLLGYWEANGEVIDIKRVEGLVRVAAQAYFFRRSKRKLKDGIDAAAFADFLDWSGLGRHLWKAPEYRRIIARAECAAERYGPLSSERAAKILGITAQERADIGIRTMGAVDETREQRIAKRKFKHKCAQAVRRSEQARAEGRVIVPRSQSLSRRQPWIAKGVSRRTWYRRYHVPGGTTTCATRYPKGIFSSDAHETVPTPGAVSRSASSLVRDVGIVASAAEDVAVDASASGGLLGPVFRLLSMPVQGRA